MFPDGRNSNKSLRISADVLKNEDFKSFKEFLQKINILSRKLVTLIDSSEEITVSFGVYEGLSQFANIDLDTKDHYCNILLQNI